MSVYAHLFMDVASVYEFTVQTHRLHKKRFHVTLIDIFSDKCYGDCKPLLYCIGTVSVVIKEAHTSYGEFSRETNLPFAI